MDINQPEQTGILHNEIPLLNEGIKINKQEKNFCNLANKEKHVLHIWSSK